MANPEHLAKLKAGVEVWNEWRRTSRRIAPNLRGGNLYGFNLSEVDLTGAKAYQAHFSGARLCAAYLSGADLRRAYLYSTDLSRANLSEANLSEAELREAELRKADLSGVDLSGAHLGGVKAEQANPSGANLSGVKAWQADFSEANLRRADLSDANLRGANLSGADLSGANLTGANFRGADVSEANFRAAELSKVNFYKADLSRARLSRANLCEADLREATLIDTDLGGANLTSCSVFGISAWNVRLKGATQSNLVITRKGESVIQVDNLEVAQFIYLLLNNENIRRVIDTITSKIVLVLGRFTPERKAVLDGIREELRKRNYLPVLFDFKKPDSRSFTETVSTLAHMARFVIADLSDPRSIPQELMAIIPTLPSVPVQPLLLESETEYGMFRDFREYPWVLEPFRYTDKDTLLSKLREKVIAPAESKVKLRRQR
jgi:uncharacterized protein YjbI with pentapeptide repeats